MSFGTDVYKSVDTSRDRMREWIMISHQSAEISHNGPTTPLQDNPRASAADMDPTIEKDLIVGLNTA